MLLHCRSGGSVGESSCSAARLLARDSDSLEASYETHVSHRPGPFLYNKILFFHVSSASYLFSRGETLTGYGPRSRLVKKKKSVV